MRKLITLALTALASVPIIGLSAITATAPVFADTPGVAPTCFPQSANPHPTAPVGQTTDTIFCTPTNSSGSGMGGSGSTGSGAGAKTGGASTAGGSTAGGGQTSLASSTGSGTPGSTPDESMRFNWASDSNGATSATGKPATAKGSGLFGSLVSFFSSVGGIVTLFGLLLLLLLILAAVAVMGWLRPAQGQNSSSRFSRLTFRA
ncbi:MAG: hypothetical protein QOH92_1134 [Chloroflexota bacterium]|nr:hypothetical protein [Chloroflexota bacterium]